MMAKAKQAPWRSRIVGYGDEQTDQLLANPRNWRIHPKAQQDALSGVLREVGVVQNIIVNKTTGTVVDGHMRITLALREGQPTLPVTYVELTEAEEALILASLDPIAAMAAADKEKLDELLREVQTGDAAVQAMLAELAEKSGLYHEPKEAPDAQIDKAEELQAKWQVQRGQVWEIGKHKLMCGDSTSAEDVARLMAGERAHLVLTDPPYNVGLAYGDGSNDSMAKGEYLTWSLAWFDLCYECGHKMIFTPGGVNLAMWLSMVVPTAVGCWVKKGATGGAHGSVSQFQNWEPILFVENSKDHHARKYAFTTWLRSTGVDAGQIDAATRSNMGGHYLSDKSQPAIPTPAMWLKMAGLFEAVPPSIKQLIDIRVDSGFGRVRHSDVFEYSPADHVRDGHPCPKPLAFWGDLVEYYSEAEQAVYDPFLGSGTTAVAAEQLGRRCYGMEIEPKYCAVSLERLSQMVLECKLAED